MSSTRSSSRALGRRSKAEDHDDQRGTKRPRRRAATASGSSGARVGTALPSSSTGEEEDLGIVSMSEPEDWEEEDAGVTVLAAVAAATVAAAALEVEEEAEQQEEASPPPACPHQKQSSKFKGVCWGKRGKKWQAQLKSNGKLHYLGSFESEEAAARAVDEFVREHDLVDSRGLNLPTTAERAQGKRARKGKLGHNTSSRYIGVSFNKRDSKWTAHIGANHKKRLLGYFINEEEAATAYDKAAAPLGRPLNFPHKHRTHGQAAAAAAAAATAEEGNGEEEASPPTSSRKPPTSKFKGVTWNKLAKRWKAEPWSDGKMHYIGYYQSEEAAARAVDEFMRKNDLVDSKGLNFPTTAERAQGKYAVKGKKGLKNGNFGGANATSQFIGVSFRKDRGKWQAGICSNNKSRGLGYFDSEKEAAAAYDKAAAPLGRPLNFSHHHHHAHGQAAAAAAEEQKEKEQGTLPGAVATSSSSGKRKAEAPAHHHRTTGRKRQHTNKPRSKRAKGKDPATPAD